MTVVYVGGVVFGLGLAVSEMTHMEVVLSFLRLEDLGLIVLMGVATVVMGTAVAVAPAALGNAPIGGGRYTRRLKSFDRQVLAGGVLFGIGWGVSGVCPGAAYASLGVGNLPVVWGLAGMFAGAYVQGVVRSRWADSSDLGAALAARDD
ncbi:MAG: YeeE/YedE family protein [Halanaeroarchaeum sp.]